MSRKIKLTVSDDVIIIDISSDIIMLDETEQEAAVTNNTAQGVAENTVGGVAAENAAQDVQENADQDNEQNFMDADAAAAAVCAAAEAAEEDVDTDSFIEMLDMIGFNIPNEDDIPDSPESPDPFDSPASPDIRIMDLDNELIVNDPPPQYEPPPPYELLPAYDPPAYDVDQWLQNAESKLQYSNNEINIDDVEYNYYVDSSEPAAIREVDMSASVAPALPEIDSTAAAVSEINHLIVLPYEIPLQEVVDESPLTLLPTIVLMDILDHIKTFPERFESVREEALFVQDIAALYISCAKEKRN